MAKFIVDEEIAMATIAKWGSGELTRAIMRDIFSQSNELIYCENCDMSKRTIAPFLQKQFVYCDYYHTDMCRKHFCSHGERRKDYAPESCD